MEPIHIFEGMTMIGMRDHLGQWWKIEQHCVRCGQCCLDQGPEWIFAMDEYLGGCKYLEEETSETYRCDLGGYRPLGCSGNSPFSMTDYCSVRMEKIDDPSSLL